jgi:hypothetical protein
MGGRNSGFLTFAADTRVIVVDTQCNVDVDLNRNVMRQVQGRISGCQQFLTNRDVRNAYLFFPRKIKWQDAYLDRFQLHLPISKYHSDALAG